MRLLIEKSQHMNDEDKCEVSFHVEGERTNGADESIIMVQKDFDTYPDAEYFATDESMHWIEVSIVCITRTVLSFKQREPQ